MTTHTTSQKEGPCSSADGGGPFTVALTIQSDTRYLALLRQLVDSIADVVGRARFPAKARHAVSLALIEAVDNAIFHAHDRVVGMPIDVVLSVDERRVRVEVGDRGEGFVMGRHDAPDGLATHGRGLFLISSMVDTVENVCENDMHWVRMTYEL